MAKPPTKKSQRRSQRAADDQMFRELTELSLIIWRSYRRGEPEDFAWMSTIKSCRDQLFRLWHRGNPRDGLGPAGRGSQIRVADLGALELLANLDRHAKEDEDVPAIKSVHAAYREAGVDPAILRSTENEKIDINTVPSPAAVRSRDRRLIILSDLRRVDRLGELTKESRLRIAGFPFDRGHETLKNVVSEREAWGEDWDKVRLAVETGTGIPVGMRRIFPTKATRLRFFLRCALGCRNATTNTTMKAWKDVRRLRREQARKEKA